MIENYPAWINGTYCKVKDLSVSVLDLGLIHCDATYEVINAKDNKIFMFDEHLERLWQSAEYWKLKIPLTKSEIKEIIITLCQRSNENNLLIWIGLTRGIPSSGNPRDLNSCSSNLFLYVKPYFGFNKKNSATVCISKIKRIPDFSINQKYKNFAWNDLTMAQWEAIERNYDSALLLSHEGYITEGPGFNVFFIKGKTIYTPMNNCLGGITLVGLERICEENNYTFLRANINLQNISTMDYAGIASTAGNLIPITELEDHSFGDNYTFIELQHLMERKTNEWITKF